MVRLECRSLSSLNPKQQQNYYWKLPEILVVVVVVVVNITSYSTVVRLNYVQYILSQKIGAMR